MGKVLAAQCAQASGARGCAGVARGWIVQLSIHGISAPIHGISFQFLLPLEIDQLQYTVSASSAIGN